MKVPVIASLAISIITVSVGMEAFDADARSYDFGDAILPRIIVLAPMAAFMCFIAYFMFPSRRSTSSAVKTTKKSDEHRAQEMAQAKAKAHWRQLPAEVDEDHLPEQMSDDEAQHQAHLAQARGRPPSTLETAQPHTKVSQIGNLPFVLAMIGWPLVFWAYVHFAEPYGSYVSPGERANLLLIFFVSWLGAVLLIFSLAKNNKFQTVSNIITATPGMTKTALKNTTKRKITAVQTAEITEYIDILQGADDEELGIAVATALHMAEKYRFETGVDLFQPMLAIQQNPEITFQFANEVEQAQASGEVHRSTPLLVWAHTLRGFSNPALRRHARSMWTELSRGFPYAESAAQQGSIIYGEELDIQRLGEFPDGLAPNKKEATSTSLATDVEAELERLNDLFERGLITEETLSQLQQDVLRKT
jgi:hypothetical protein